jgi:hypothetical protein
MSLHPDASAAVEAYMQDVDVALPGLIDEVYVTGSASMGDFHPEISDVDVVAVGSRGANEADLDTLAILHHPSRPFVDVLYITGADLLGDPRLLSSAYSLAGTFHRQGAFAANPVTWRDLQTRATSVRGRELRESDVWFDADVLRRWNVDNLERYWRGQVESWCRVEPTEARVRHEYGLQWLVLGVPRLHFTISTLEVTSKTAAGYYALEVVDRQWHPLIEAAIALRADQGAPVRMSPEQARDQAVELAVWFIEDAHRLLGD